MYGSQVNLQYLIPLSRSLCNVIYTQFEGLSAGTTTYLSWSQDNLILSTAM